MIRLFLLVIVFLTMAMPQLSQAQQIGKVAVIYKEGQPTVVMWRRIADQIEKETQGRVQFKIYPNGQLGGEKEVAEGMRLGSIQAADSTLATLTAWVPEGALFDLPFVFRDRMHIERVMSGEIGEDYKRKYEAQDFHVLGYIVYGSRDLVSRKAVIRPEDIKGQKMRVLQSPLHIKVWQTLGAEPMPIPITEAYSALDTGVVDLMDMTTDGYEALKLYEVAPYLIETNHIWSIGAIIVAKKFWDSLTAVDQTIIQKAANDAIPFFNGLQADTGAGALNRTREKGAKISQTSREAWQKAMLPVWKEWADKVGGAAAIDAIIKTP